MKQNTIVNVQLEGLLNWFALVNREGGFDLLGIDCKVELFEQTQRKYFCVPDDNQNESLSTSN